MPALMKFAERFALRLSSDPSVIACFRDELPGNDWDAGAIVLQRSRLVPVLARQRLGMPLPPAKPRRRKIPGPPPPQRPGSREQPRRRKPRAQSHSEVRSCAMKRALQRRPSDEMINEFIVTQIREMMAEARAGVCNGNLRIYATNRETGRPVKLSDADLSVQPSVPGIVMNNLSRYKDVTFERVEEPAKEAPAAVQDKPNGLETGGENHAVADCHNEGQAELRPDAPDPDFGAASVLRQNNGDRKNKTKGGRPPLYYKEKVIDKTVDWLDDQGSQDQSKVIKFMCEIIAKIDDGGGPGDSTLKRWAKEASEKLRRRRETIGETPLGPGQ